MIFSDSASSSSDAKQTSSNKSFPGRSNFDATNNSLPDLVDIYQIKSDESIHREAISNVFKVPALNRYTKSKNISELTVS